MCGGAPSDGRGMGSPSPSKAASVSLAGGADTKPAPSYADRLVRLMHLVDPRHALTTAEDIQHHRALLQESKAGPKVRPRYTQFLAPFDRGCPSFRFPSQASVLRSCRFKL